MATCPSASSAVGWEPPRAKETKELTAIVFLVTTRRFSQAHLQGLDLILITETFACLARRGRCTLSSALGDTLREVPTGVSPYSYLPVETKQTGWVFLIFCLDLSRLNVAAWDTKAKTEPLFAFCCNMEIFSGRSKSQSSQTLQAAPLEMPRSPPSFMSLYTPKDKKTSN